MCRVITEYKIYEGFIDHQGKRQGFGRYVGNYGSYIGNFKDGKVHLNSYLLNDDGSIDQDYTGWF